ncbi:hypothetical protein M514_08262 [Trichuris suis]|uniref:Dynein light chain n=1 Tax=Trichuris suis TaxID=68888 RepID=A0A085NHF9_9BILA|nr:hypothetical protein M513_08262 [Trichuris suis]KFD68905.1 hypothetical protein M514_08262 [Trichuris suis]
MESKQGLGSIVQQFKPAVIMTEMDMTAQTQAIDIAIDAVRKHSAERKIAAEIKRAFDRKYGGKWHCIVGREYGCYLDHAENCFIYLFIGRYAIALWR